MGKSVMVNGLNITPLITPWGYTVSYRKIQGGNQGTMLDGSFLDDPLAYKATIFVTCMPLAEEDYSGLMNTLYDASMGYANVQFFDPRINDYRSAECTFTASSQKERGKGADGKIRWTGLSLTFEER